MNSILCISLLLLSVCSAQTLVEVLKQNSATTLLQLSKTDSQLFKALSTFKGTVFAPTNDAFTDALKDTDRFTQDSTTDRVLKYHLIPDVVFERDVVGVDGTEFLVSLNGSDVKVTGTASGVVVSSAWNAPQANVVKTSAFDGGVVHFIDQTLTPPLGIVDVAKAAGLTSLVSAVVQAGLARTVINLKDATVFAPSNEAIAQISSLVNTLSKEQLAQVLLLHVVPNQRLHSTDFATSALLTASTEARVQVQKGAQGVAVSGPGNDVPARVVTADLLASVGIVMHVIDKVLLPAGMVGGESASSEQSTDASAMKGTLRVGKLATAAVEGTTGGASLISVLTENKATTLLSLVQSDKPILNALTDFKGTLFAPTDKALAASVAAGFNPKNLTLLSTVLKYHAIPTTVFAAKSFSGTQFLKSLEGDEVKASGSSAKGITITSAFGGNTANVVSSMAFSGGIVHFIDTTLTPPMDIVTVAKQAKLTALLNAIMTAGLVDTIVNLKTATVFAPSDQAFAAISATKLSKDQLKQVLLMHVVPGKLVHSTEAAEAKNLPSVGTAASGQMISVQSDGTTVLVKGGGNKNPAKVVVADVVVMGPLVVHVIDQVLLPANLSAGVGSIAVLNVAFWMALFIL
ncbi:hypothetical protein HDU81_006508 [Chytriomyces hyalinus]|nr:hypothetical protein HDU81_006508 [Chytriomyces hyalinus]